MAYVVTLPLKTHQADELVRSMCSTAIQLLMSLNTTFDHLADSKVPFLDMQPTAGINGFPKHTNLEPVTLQLYYWGPDSPDDNELAKAFIMLPDWLAKSMQVHYNVVAIKILMDPHGKVLTEFIRETPQDTHKSVFIDSRYFVNGQWEVLPNKK